MTKKLLDASPATDSRLHSCFLLPLPLPLSPGGLPSYSECGLVPSPHGDSGMSANSFPVPSPARKTPPRQEFRYGWRYVKRLLPDGTEDLEQVPLTLEDVLHPQEGDVIPEKPLHRLDCDYLAQIFRSRERRIPRGLVLVDCLVNWDVPGVRDHSPDLSAFADVKKRPPLEIGTFLLGPSNGRCVLALA